MLTELFEKRKRNELEVEDILQLAKGGIKKIFVNDLKNLKIIKVEGNEQKENQSINLWIDIIIDFFENGYQKLIEVAKAGDKKAVFAIGVLEETKTIEGFRSLIAILKNCSIENPVEYEIAVATISAINNMISFDSIVTVEESDASVARQFIHNFLIYANNPSSNEKDLVIAYCALRKIGDLNTIKLIKKMRPLSRPENLGIDSVAISAIKSRIK